MADKNCAACSDLRENSAEFVLNGVTDEVCEYLQENKGLSGDSNDCDDLHDVNDCLIGNMDSEVDSYDVCDWKDFMHAFIPNLWNTLKAMICSICGLWDKVEELECDVDYLANGATFNVGEATEGNAYIVAGKGVSFLNVSSSWGSADVSITYVAGGIAKVKGSYLFYDSDFTDNGSCYSFDNDGVNPTWGSSRKGNDVWGSNPTHMVAGGELIAEIRIKRSAFPQIKKIYSGFGQETGGGSYHVTVVISEGGNYAMGQHGACNEDGTPAADGYSHGHLVPEGWTYIQLRMQSMFYMNANGSQYSPNCFICMRMNLDGVDC